MVSPSQGNQRVFFNLNLPFFPSAFEHKTSFISPDPLTVNHAEDRTHRPCFKAAVKGFIAITEEFSRFTVSFVFVEIESFFFFCRRV
jgi:hypothetical protein